MLSTMLRKMFITGLRRSNVEGRIIACINEQIPSALVYRSQLDKIGVFMAPNYKFRLLMVNKSR